MQETLFETTLERKFSDFDRKNPQVYKELVELALQAKHRGRRKIGIGMLFEVLRWNRFILTTDPDFKLNNNYRSRYARKLMAEHRELEGIFEIRGLKS